jgi:voltage-gated potassium channel
VFNAELLIGTLVILASVFFHVACLVTLAKTLRRASQTGALMAGRHGTMLLFGTSVIVIIGIHTIEAWGWAPVYMSLGEFTDLETALYFSVVTSTTLGYGDVVLSDSWRLLGTFEAMGGLILFGASTAFLLGLMRKLFTDEPQE